jgi:uncharacterized protein (TIGR02466 family)
MRWLVRAISRTATGMVRKLSTQSVGMEVLLKECWFNIGEAGAWNMPHTHPAWWSGVVYISGDFTVEGGEIMFFNPVPRSIQGGYPDHVMLRPEAGMMLLFPGHLSHMVTPYAGTGPRISVSFNIDPLERGDGSISSESGAD